MNEAHQRFHDWLTGGAEGDPPRDAAVHASVCPGCHRSIDALDRLAAANTGLARMPARPIGRERGPFAMAGRLVGATAVLFSAAILGIGVSQLIGSQSGGPVAQASPTPDQSVLAETATPGSSEAVPTPSATSVETLTPLGTPAPPAVTPIPRRTSAPVPIVTPAATPVPTPLATAVPTPIPTPVPTATPAPTPTPPVDTDGDGITDADEGTYGSDPNNTLSTPENSLYAAATCNDGTDNDLDTLTDVDDPGCS